MAESRTYEGNGHRVRIADPENITRGECLQLALCGQKAWNHWRKEYPVRNADHDSYENQVNFFQCDFRKKPIDFSGFLFGDSANFGATKFGEGINFTNATFGKDTVFSNALFEKDACFSSSHFEGTVYFIGAYFDDGCNFNSAKFLGKTLFIGAQFGRIAYFESTEFYGLTNFNATTWKEVLLEGEVDKRIEKAASNSGANPEKFGAISWKNAIFEGVTSFNGRVFKDKTIFSNATFSTAPLFHNCEIYADTRFNGAIFPAASGDIQAINAYRTLKLAFSKQQAIREEQLFFKLEMKEEAASEKGWRRWLYRAYRELSDFGFSVGRPVILFLATTVLTGLIYGWQAELVFDSANTHTAALIHFSLASAIPGLEKLAEPAALRLFGEISKGIVNYSLPTVFTLLAHKAVTLLALFLIGLALRNLFKMK